MIYRLGNKLNLARFFTIIGVLLMVFAAGLLADSVENLQQLGWLPVLDAPSGIRLASWRRAASVLDRALAVGDAGPVSGERQERPDPEVPARARRRRFTAQYKQQVLAAYEAAPDGEKGAILRREGLYSSLISEWRRARDAGALAGLKQPAGRPATDPRDVQIARLQKEKAKLEQELAKARFVAGVQSKLQALLEG